MKRKRILKSIAFVILVCIMLTGLGAMLREKDGCVSDFYALPDGCVSALFVGGSHVNATYIPATLWSEYGIASHNLFSPNQPMWTTYHYIREALKTQKPDVIVLELFGMTYGHSYSQPSAIDSDNATAGFKLRMSPNLYEMMAASAAFGVESPPLAEYFNIVRYHYRWKEANGSFFEGMSARPSMMRGYELIARTEAFDDDDFSETAEQFPPYIGAQVYLKLIANLAKRENIPLLLTISPYACNDVERGIFSWLKEFAAEREINILNYNGADGVRVGIDRSSDLSDIGHTNYGGAVKVTRDVGAFLEKNYTLRSRVKVADAAQRDADAEQFDQKAKISTDITTVDPAAFFSRAAADSSYTVLVAGKPNETQMAAFLPMGFVSAKAGECFAGLSSGGKPITESSGEGARISQALGNYDVIGKPDSSEIVVNGTSYLAPGGIAVLLFKNDFGWPLDFAVFTDGVLEHSEFTSSDLEALLSHRGAVEEKE